MRRCGWMIILILIVGCSGNPASSLPPAITLATETTIPAERVTVASDQITIVVPGYKQSCLDPVLSIPTTDGWKPLEDFIMQHHYLDDQFVFVAAMCDYIVCSKVDQQNSFSIRFPLYENIGERPYLFDHTGTIDMMPAYRTVYPSQTVRLDVTYFLDEACSQRKVYSTTINLTN